MAGLVTDRCRWTKLVCCLLYVFVTPVLTQVPPGVPIITGPQFIVMGDIVTLTCTVTGGQPTPTVKWLRDDALIDDSDKQVGNTVVNIFTFTASANEHHAVYECQSANGVLQNPLSRTKFVEVYKPPSDPVLTGPTDLLSGTEGVWTCKSTGSYPPPTMALRIENNEFSADQVAVKVAYDTRRQQYNITGTLNWSPTTVNNGQTLYCDVFHTQTLGNTPKTVDLPLTVRSPLTVNAPKTSYAPNTGETISLTCVITSGVATQIKWYKNNNIIIMTQNLRLSGGNVNTPSLTIANVEMSDAGSYICEAGDGSVTKRTNAITVTTKSSPQTPVITGPSTVISGTSKTWTCVSEGGNPQPSMSIRLGNTVFNNEVNINTEFIDASKSYKVTATIVWTPSSTDNAKTLYCDVSHPETLGNTPQTVNLPLTVHTSPQMPTLTGPTSVKSGTPFTWTCTSVGAYPEQSMSMRLGSTPISSGFTTNSVYDAATQLYRFTGTLVWSPTAANGGDRLFCDVTHPETLQTPQTVSLQLTVQTSPQTPTLTGPTDLISGTSRTWTCLSVGGSPQPSMSMRIGNRILNNEVSVTSVFDSSSKSYRVTGTLDWTPSSQHNQETLYCDVTHTETLGNTPQTVSLPLTVKTPPNTPVLNGPTSVKAGIDSTWTCTSVGAYPEQTMSMKIGNSAITNGFTTNAEYNSVTKLYKVIGTFRWSPSTSNNEDILQCEVLHTPTLGQTPQTASLQLTVQTSPQKPTLAGPTTVNSGTSNTWTCVSEGGYPEASMSMRIENIEFTSGITINSVFDIITKSYRTTGTVVWAPSSRNNGHTLYCDATHAETMGNIPQTVSLPLIVNTAPSAPVLAGPTTTISGKINTWTCTSVGAYPEQTMSMRVGNTIITSGITLNSVFDTITKLYKMTGTLVWAPSTTNNGNTLFCDVTHTETLGPNPQTDSLSLIVHTTPMPPTLNGPTRMTAGLSKTWTCTSVGGFPQQTMRMRVGNTVFNNELTTNAIYNQNTQLYTVTGTLVWAPSIGHDHQILTCDVFHQETLGDYPQSVSLPELNIHAAIEVTAPTTYYQPMVDDTVTLNCIVTAGTATSIKWYKNNRLITVNAANPRFSGAVPNDPTLIIKNVMLTDVGNYICEGTSEYGLSTDQSTPINLSPVERPITEFVIITTILDGYNKLVRPVDPLNNITHSLVPKYIMEFDGKQLTMQTMQCMKWNDPRLSWPKGQPRVSLPASSIWVPDVVLLGEKYMPDFATKVIVKKDGNVVYCPQGPILATDCQEKAGEVYECKFKFLSWSYDLVMLDVRFPATKTADSLIDLSMFAEHDKYEIVSRCGVRNEMTYSCRDGTYPELTYTVTLRRRRTYCINLSGNPTCN